MESKYFSVKGTFLDQRGPTSAAEDSRLLFLDEKRVVDDKDWTAARGAVAGKSEENILF